MFESTEHRVRMFENSWRGECLSGNYHLRQMERTLGMFVLKDESSTGTVYHHYYSYRV